MNRLIIIGNGFDLAHGMKTSFNDFITDYLYNAINTFLKEDKYLDSLFHIGFHKTFLTNKRTEKVVTKEKIHETLKEFDKNPNIICNRSILLQQITTFLNARNWVDVEMEYFRLLKMSTAKNSVNVGKLNSEFTYLKSKLIEYLKKQQEKFEFDNDLTPLSICFTQDIRLVDFATPITNSKPTSLYFLNFNYTNTFLPYYNKCNDSIDSAYNYIHGSLDGKNGNPIFGFGDEFDKKYLEFEDLGNKEYFSHIKSFEYSKNRNYFNLLKFIDSDIFQVHIYGHSCGVSDRTMLNSIFEHTNCKSIKIFYHKYDEENNDFIDKTFDIYRHFKDKGDMRRKIVPLENCEPMPQPVEKLNKIAVTI